MSQLASGQSFKHLEHTKNKIWLVQTLNYLICFDFTHFRPYLFLFCRITQRSSSIFAPFAALASVYPLAVFTSMRRERLSPKRAIKRVVAFGTIYYDFEFQSKITCQSVFKLFLKLFFKKKQIKKPRNFWANKTQKIFNQTKIKKFLVYF